MAFVEEAIGPHDTEGFKELRRKTRVPVCGGEIITTPWDMISRMKDHVYEFVQPDASVIGGFSALEEIFAATEESKTAAVVHAWGGFAKFWHMSTPTCIPLSFASFKTQAVNDVVQFIEQTQNLSGQEMAFVEEAIGPHDTEGFKELRRKTRVPVCGGEIITTPWDMISRMKDHVYEFVQPDASVIGGFSALEEIFAATEESKTAAVVHAWGGFAKFWHMSTPTCIPLSFASFKTQAVR